MLVVEAVIERRSDDGVSDKCSGGTAILDIFSETATGARVANFESSSPREISMFDHEKIMGQQNRVGKCNLVYDCRDFPQFKSLQTLVPQNCLVGRHNVVPGLLDDVFKLPRENPKANYSEA